jgi:hypothetical protein
VRDDVEQAADFDLEFVGFGFLAHGGSRVFRVAI